MSGRGELLEGAKASPVAIYLGTILAGVDWGVAAAAAATIYSLILIGEKVWRYVIRPLWRRFGPKPA